MNAVKFKSKIDWWAHLVLAVVPLTNIFLIIEAVRHDDVLLPFTAGIFLLLTIFLIIPAWVNTCYIFGETELLVYCGLMCCEKIPYRAVVSVKESRSLLSAAALSLDRIEIIFGFGDSVLVSPKHKQEFLRQLQNKTERDKP